MKYWLLSLLVGVTLSSCNTNKEKKQSSVAPQNLVEKNKVWVKKDRQTIVGYLSRKNIEMNESSTGLWYTVFSNNKGEKVEIDKLIEINYEVYLLDGTLCYSSKNEGTKTFLVGKGGVERGLEEAVLLLNEGDSANFIIPPHLAHGNTGDDTKIPPRAILDYRIKVIKVF